MLIWVLKIIAVVALLGVAAAISTPKDRLPLALRGIARIMRKDRGFAASSAADGGTGVSVGRRILAFVLVLAAVLVAVF